MNFFLLIFIYYIHLTVIHYMDYFYIFAVYLLVNGNTAPRGYRVARDSIVSCCVEPGQNPFSWWLVGHLGACG